MLKYLFVTEYKLLVFELEAEIESRNDTIPLRRTSDAQTEPSDDTDQDLFGLNARDMLPYRKNVQHSDILNFQVRCLDFNIYL